MRRLFKNTASLISQRWIDRAAVQQPAEWVGHGVDGLKFLQPYKSTRTLNPP